MVDFTKQLLQSEFALLDFLSGGRPPVLDLTLQLVPFCEVVINLSTPSMPGRKDL